ncbi:hypothetical protein LTR62_005536 [Meristemomyces frigidus]|uniref:DUF1772-domain-containing protein n=1 Tax=Meristemomyces frigidus TaxID=1508187 RepID=A0AAN7YNF7_9PEZI|nr:hypothetical protein LTR62_005536 [Meristemomyces frigidus]
MDTIRTAKLLAVPAALFLGSYNLTFSQNVMPHLYNDSAAVLTPLFEKIYHRGAATILPIATIAIASNAYLAYESSDYNKRRLYTSAALLVSATLPLTQLVMKGGIDRLIAISGDVAAQKQLGINTEVVELLKSWAAWNYLRASLHLTGGVLAFYAALS